MDKEIYGPEIFLHKFDFGMNCPIIMMEFTAFYLPTYIIFKNQHLKKNLCV